MAFRFKDLMIQVVPQGQGGGDDPVCTLASKEPDPAALMPCTLASKPDELAARGCAEATEAQCSCTLATKESPIPAAIACTLASRIEPWNPRTIDPAALGTITTVTTVTTVTTLVQGGGGSRGGDLASLKSQLRAALEDIERQERAQQGDGLPATVEEADDLERRLREAIEELQDHRKTLQKEEKAESSRNGPKGGAKKGKGRK